MVEQEVMFYTIDKESCEYLESLNLSYKEMVSYFKTDVNVEKIRYYFFKHGIHHKSKSERILAMLENDPFRSANSIAIKLDCTTRLVHMVRASMEKKTRIKVWYEDNIFNCIILGHSGYAPKGYDIVCASISSISTYLVNSISQWKEINEKHSDKKGYLEFSFSVDNEIEHFLIDSFIEYLRFIESEYPEYVSIV